MPGKYQNTKMESDAIMQVQESNLKISSTCASFFRPRGRHRVAWDRWTLRWVGPELGTLSSIVLQLRGWGHHQKTLCCWRKSFGTWGIHHIVWRHERVMRWIFYQRLAGRVQEWAGLQWTVIFPRSYAMLAHDVWSETVLAEARWPREEFIHLPCSQRENMAKILNKINIQLLPYCKHVLGELNGAIAMVLISWLRPLCLWKLMVWMSFKRSNFESSFKHIK